MGYTSEDWAGTKLALIHAAGELFAEKGLRGASVRAIAEKGKTNIAAVNYHFGSKENLHTEVMRYVLSQVHLMRLEAILADPSWFSSNARKAELIEMLTKERFESYFSPERPAWFARFMVRSMMARSRSLETVLQEEMAPEHEALNVIFRKCKPELSEEEARFWSFSFSAQIVFYVFRRNTDSDGARPRRIRPGVHSTGSQARVHGNGAGAWTAPEVI